MARSDHLVSYSMRDPQQLIDHAHRSDGASDWSYDPAMDAAKVIWRGGTNTRMVRFPLVWNGAGGSVFATWDAKFGPSFQTARGSMHTSKTFQFSRSGARIWMEPRSRYGGHVLPEIAHIDVRYYGTPGPGTSRGAGDRIEPMLATFVIHQDRWTRYWARFEVSGSWWLWSLWAADEQTAPVQIHDRLAVTPAAGGIDLFWLEYNTSQSPGGDMTGWARNFVALRGITLADTSSLRVKPVS